MAQPTTTESDPCADDKALKPWEIADDDERWQKIDPDGGLMKLIVKEADEEDAPMPGKGEKVSCHYTGFLRDGGKLFDSSKQRGEFFKFDLGKGSVIKGWDEGIATMKIGEKAILRCSSDFAYGDNGSPPNIPGGATLDFVVELEDVQSFESIWDIDDAKESILKKTVKEPEGWETAKEQSTVVLNVTGREKDHKGRIFLELKKEEIKVPFDLEFNHKGVIADYPHPRGFYKCIQQLGKSCVMQFKLKCTEPYTFGATGSEKYGIAPNTDLFYEFELLEMTSPKSLWQLDNKEKIPFAKELKAKAGGYFKQKKIEVAKKLYKDVLDAVRNIQELSDEEQKEVDALKATCHSNVALILTQMGENTDAFKEIEEGLKIDPKHIKLRYRKAQVQYKRANYQEALEVLSELLADEPANKGAITLQAKSKTALKAVKKKQRNLAKKMFKGFGKKKGTKECSTAAADAEKKPAEENKAAEAGCCAENAAST